MEEKYIWTNHAHYKMRGYRLSESLVKRIIRYPTRTEESIVPGTIACMKPAQSKNYSEVWVMYKITRGNSSTHTKTSANKSAGRRRTNGQIKIITAWRYPAKSPKRNPIPHEILNEIQSLL